MMRYLVFSYVIFLLQVLASLESPIISLEDGIIQGTFKTSYNGRKFSAFEGIPYAQPPIRNLRFIDPRPVRSWKGVLHANKVHTCLQLERLGTQVIGQEDCLYLNVYVPRECINPNETLHVIVHFHGGAFVRGYPNELDGPSKLIDRDVIYVNLNYRIGPLGFLSIGNAVLPGNYGLKDQVFALQWIQKNIRRFGGNPNSVTITGASSGGASVYLHYFSPLSKGLFHRGWVGNAAVLNPWVIRKDPETTGKRLAEEIGCLHESTAVILRCLRERPALQIQSAFAKLYKHVELYMPLVLFGPVIEPFLPTSFLNADPYLQLKTKIINDVPLTLIMTSDEGILPSAFYLQKLEELNHNLNYYLSDILEYDNYDQSMQKEVTEKIKSHYFNSESITTGNFRKFIKLCTDRLFHIGAEKSVKLHANATKSKVYFIMMSYGGENKSGYEDLGVPHCQDMKFYYDAIRIGTERLATKEEDMKEKMLDLFVNFAKTGEPLSVDINFEAVPKDGSLRYLLVKSPNDIEMTNNSLGDNEFWMSLGLKEDENVYNVTEKVIEILSN